MKYLITLAIALSALASSLPAQTQAQPAELPSRPAETRTELEPARMQATQAQTESAGAWTLEQCMLYAVEHSPETNIQQTRNEIARQDYREAIGQLLPSLSASVDANFNFGRSLGDDNVYVDANSFNNSYSAYSSLTIFDGLRNINGIRLQRINRITGRHQLEQKRDEVAFATMEAFFNVLYYKNMVLLAESQLEESRLNLRQAERMEELGMMGFPDVAEMRAKEASDSYRLTQQQNLLAIGIILLKEQMNFPIEALLDIAPYDMEGEVAKTPATAAELYERALEYLPKAQAASSAALASEVALKYARGARYPTISLGAGYSTGFFRNFDGSNYDSFSHQFVNKRGYYVGASLSIPIFNGFSTSAYIKRTKYQLEIARTERDATLRTLYKEIEQAVADMNGTADQHIQAVRQREFSSVAHDVNRRKYDEGLVSALELHTSSNRLVQARADELYSRLTYILKKRMVDYYCGVPFIETESEN